MEMIVFDVAFKYVLIDCKNQDQSFTIVRGYAWVDLPAACSSGVSLLGRLNIMTTSIRTCTQS